MEIITKIDGIYFKEKSITGAEIEIREVLDLIDAEAESGETVLIIKRIIKGGTVSFLKKRHFKVDERIYDSSEQTFKTVIEWG